MEKNYISSVKLNSSVYEIKDAELREIIQMLFDKTNINYDNTLIKNVEEKGGKE